MLSVIPGCILIKVLNQSSNNSNFSFLPSNVSVLVVTGLITDELFGAGNLDVIASANRVIEETLSLFGLSCVIIVEFRTSFVVSYRVFPVRNSGIRRFGVRVSAFVVLFSLLPFLAIPSLSPCDN